MSAERLTDDYVDAIARHGNDRERALATEVRSLRALLDTPLPCGWDKPQPADGGVVRWEDNDYSADELLAVGATIVRASLAAKGETL